jgi:hypothetical protein
MTSFFAFAVRGGLSDQAQGISRRTLGVAKVKHVAIYSAPLMIARLVAKIAFTVGPRLRSER